MIYGYLRGSTGDIDKANQRKAIERYAKKEKLKVTYIEDTVSSGKPYKDREISGLVEGLRDDDVLIVAELSRLARNVEESLMIGRKVLEHQAEMIILNPAINLSADDDISTKIMLNTMAMSAEIERYYIRSRTKLSLQQRKEQIAKQGYFINKKGEKVRHLGTAKGSKKSLKLEPHKEEIYKLVGVGLSHEKIGKQYGVSRHTVAHFLKRFPYESQQLIDGL